MNPTKERKAFSSSTSSNRRATNLVFKKFTKETTNCVMGCCVLNATFNSISALSWLSV